METFTHGLLSGSGHPLLGFDHLFFAVAVGIAAVYTGYARSAPAVFIAAMLAGCVMTGFGIGLGVLQYAIAIAAGRVVKTVFNAAEVRAVHPRLAGALIAGAGLYLTMENVEGAVLLALGWGA